MRQKRSGPTLPKALRDQVGDPGNYGKNKSGRGAGPTTRKHRRKAEREAKKVHKQQPLRRKRDGEPSQTPGIRHESDEEEEWVGIESDQPTPSPTHTISRTEASPNKSILKRSTSTAKSDTRPVLQSSPHPPKVSRAVRDRLAEDDAEIAALEKRLGMRKKKRQSNQTDDGLDDVFGDMGGSDSDIGTFTGQNKRKLDQDDEWLATKRRKALGRQVAAPQGVDFDIESESFDVSDMEDEELRLLGNQIDCGEWQEDGDVVGGAEDHSDIGELVTENATEQIEKSRIRENPYVAPIDPHSAPAKYIPPALRTVPSSDAQALARLKRQMQGLMNRLSDANMLSILRDIEQVYQNNARGYVTSTLIDLLIGLLADETVLIDTFLILHAGFIAAIYKVIGPDFGAQMVERIVLEFDKYYPSNKEGTGKQTTNLVSVMAELYSFQMIGCNLVFDYIRMFLSELSEINTELLLRIVRVSGSQLRQDDPVSLKDIVLLLQKSVAQVGLNNMSVRTKFMIETINDLKNNKMKTGLAASAVASEHTNKMKKQLGTLNTRNLKGSEPLRIGLTDIHNTEKRGKWWLVGASWRNDTADDASTQQTRLILNDAHQRDLEEVSKDGDIDLFQLAREQRMNTDVRRAIFISIMSASDSKDAHVRLLKLNLKKAQEMEIPRVIVHCAGCEESYNPYYTQLARKFCADHKSRKCFQFALWDMFKSLGEGKDDDDDASDEDEDELKSEMTLARLVNLGKLYGTLIARDGLSIISLKILNFPYIKAKTKTLIEIMLVTVILESQKAAKGSRDEKMLLNIFINVDAAIDMITGLQFFLQKVIMKTGITASKKEKETVRWGCKIVMDMLERLMATTTIDR